MTYGSRQESVSVRYGDARGGGVDAPWLGARCWHPGPQGHVSGLGVTMAVTRCWFQYNWKGTKAREAGGGGAYRTVARRSIEASPDLNDTSPVLGGLAVTWGGFRWDWRWGEGRRGGWQASELPPASSGVGTGSTCAWGHRSRAGGPVYPGDAVPEPGEAMLSRPRGVGAVGWRG